MVNRVSQIVDLVIDDRNNILGYQKGPGTLYGIGATTAPDLPVVGSRTILDTDLEKVLDVTGAATLTIPTDAVLKLSENVKYRTVVSAYQAGSGSLSWAAGAGVTLRGIAPNPSQYTVQAIMRVGANEWAYL